MADDGERTGKICFDELNRAFIDDQDIDEVDIVVCQKCHQNQNEKAFLVHEHKLGIKSWCVKNLYLHAYRELLRQRDKKYIDYSTTDTLQVTRAVLLLGAECCVAWNTRKEMVTAGVLSVSDELQFSTLVLTKHPRSAETFAHRKWVICYYTKVKSQNDFVKQLLRRELAVCQRTAEMYPDNYTAWSHRGWVVDFFVAQKPKKLLHELKNTEHWVEMHVSDHCGFYYRQLLLKHLTKLCSENEASLLWMAELEFVSDIILTFPGHEAAWYHRRAVFYHCSLWFRDICVDSLRLWFNSQCNSEKDMECEDSSSVNRKKQEQEAEGDSCSIYLSQLRRKSSGSDSPNMTVFSSAMKSMWLQKSAKSNGCFKSCDCLSFPDVTTELEFCDKAVTSCNTDTRGLQIKLVANYRHWLHLLS